LKSSAGFGNEIETNWTTSQLDANVHSAIRSALIPSPCDGRFRKTKRPALGFAETSHEFARLLVIKFLN